MMKDLYRETGTVFRRSPLTSPEGESFASRVRAVIADHARQLQGTLERVKREGGRFTQGMAGYKQTRLPGGVVVKTWINPFGLVPTLKARVMVPRGGEHCYVESYMESGWCVYTDNEAQEWFIYEWTIKEEEFGKYRFALESTTKKAVKCIVGDEELQPFFQKEDGASYLSELERPFLGNFTPRINRPELYSGLARVLVQAMHGAGKSIRDIFPTTGDLKSGDIPNVWENDTVLGRLPEHLGCIRMEDDSYWMLLVSKLGVYAARLIVEECGFAGARAQVKTNADKDFLDSFVLAKVTKSGQSICLIDAQDPTLEEIYEVSEEDEHIQLSGWGWTWRYQKRGMIDEYTPGACIYAHYVSSKYNSVLQTQYAVSKHKLWGISFSKDESIPIIASIELIESNDITPTPVGFGLYFYTNTYYTPGGYRNAVLAHPILNPTGINRSQLPGCHTFIAAWYSKDGTLQKATWEPDVLTSSSVEFKYGRLTVQGFPKLEEFELGSHYVRDIASVDREFLRYVQFPDAEYHYTGAGTRVDVEDEHKGIISAVIIDQSPGVIWVVRDKDRHRSRTCALTLDRIEPCTGSAPLCHAWHSSGGDPELFYVRSSIFWAGGCGEFSYFEDVDKVYVLNDGESTYIEGDQASIVYDTLEPLIGNTYRTLYKQIQAVPGITNTLQVVVEGGILDASSVATNEFPGFSSAGHWVGAA